MYGGMLLIMIVIILSGLIAYLGDQIGMKVGKKRMSLFGLRPKYTSIIITIMTGVLIATLTLTIIMVTNNGFRRVIFQIQEVLTQLDTLNQQLVIKDQNLKEMKQEINTKTDELATIKLQLSDIGKQRNQLEEKLVQTQQEFKQARQDLSKSRDEISNLEDKRQELQQKNASLTEQRQELESEMDRLNQEIAQLSEEYVRSLNQLASQYDYYIGEDIVYQKGDIIHRTVIDNTRSREEIVIAITRFLQQANEKVKEQQVKADTKTGSAMMIREDEIFSLPGAINNLDSEKVIVNLVANTNVPKNGWVYASFTINKDFTVFKKEELIASSYINAAKSSDQLEKELESLLDNINIKAVRGGLLADEQGSVGSIDFSEFYELLKQIHNYQGLVKVNVYALEDIWRLDRLSSNLKFEIDSGADENNDTGN